MKFKKSIAVLTTAAIMASAMPIVAYASKKSVSWASDLITKVQYVATADVDDPGEYNDVTTTAFNMKDQTLFVTVSAKVKSVSLIIGDLNDGGTTEALSSTDGLVWSKDFTGDIGDDATIEVGDLDEDDNGDAAVNTDKIVWINGKDIKEKKDKSGQLVQAKELYKTETSEDAKGQPYGGGKWMAITVPATVAGDTATDAEITAFAGLFEKGKLKDKDNDKKKTASAKIKDGVVTVSAGKEVGIVDVWVYEINNKNLVLAGGDAEKYTVIANVKPIYIGKYTVKLAAGSIAAFDVQANIGDKTKAIKTLTVQEAPADAPAGSDTSGTGASTPAAQDDTPPVNVKSVWVTDIKNKAEDIANATWSVKVDEKYADIVEAAMDTTEKNKVIITGKSDTNDKGKGSAAVVEIKCNESGKTLKLKVTVKKEVDVTVKAAADNCSIKFTTSSGQEITLYAKDATNKALVGTKATITLAKDCTAKIGTKTIKKSGNYVISGKTEIEFEAPAADDSSSSNTNTGDDSGNAGDSTDTGTGT